MKTINLFTRVGAFAENKDVARDIRTKDILPGIIGGEEVILDFEKIEGATQSFIHALISDVIRRFGIDVLDKLKFKSCNETIKKIIGIVVEYMQNAIED